MNRVEVYCYLKGEKIPVARGDPVNCAVKTAEFVEKYFEEHPGHTVLRVHVEGPAPYITVWKHVLDELGAQYEVRCSNQRKRSRVRYVFKSGKLLKPIEDIEKILKLDKGPDPPAVKKTEVKCPYCGKEASIEHSEWLEYCSVECPYCRKIFYVDLFEEKTYTRDIYPDPL